MQSEQCKVSKQVSGASKQANGRASGPGFTSRFLAVRNHSVLQSATPLCSIFPFSFAHTFLPFLASLPSPLPFLPILFSPVNCLPRFLFICFYLFSTWRIVIAVMFFLFRFFLHFLGFFSASGCFSYISFRIKYRNLFIDILEFLSVKKKKQGELEDD